MGQHQHEQFFRATMRHFAFQRSTAPLEVASQTRFPPDWFDLPPEVLADYGAVFFLTSLARFHRRRTLDEIFATMEPPLRLGQYRIFYQNGFPRAFLTWAGLSPDCEYRFAVDHIGLDPQDWNSGSSVWLVDFISPFGHIDQIVPMLGANQQTNRVRTLHHNDDRSRYRIVEWWRPSPDVAYDVRSYGQGQFKNLLLQEAIHGNR